MPNQKSGKRKRRRLNFSRLFSLLFLLTLIGAGTAMGVLIFAVNSLPPWDPQQLSGAKTTLIYDNQGLLVNSIHAEENRTEITLTQMPTYLTDAVIYTEDDHFYQHHGIYLKGIARSILYNITSGDPTGQGASTITQQLARNAFLTLEKQWERKIKEILLAFKLEAIYSKDEILTMYLNKIYFGAGAYGVQAAAQTYFDKDVSELDLAECSLIAGLAQNPNGYNPLQFFDRAKARQKIILNNMVENSIITRSQAEEAYAQELVFQSSQPTGVSYGYYNDAVIEEALTVLSEIKPNEDPNNLLYRGGLKIYTALNQELQAYVQTLYADPNNFPTETKGGNQIQSALVLLNHSNGEIKALIGGRTYETQRGFNRATSAYRQPGSSIKPISVYSPALENGYMPFYTLNDAPLSMKIGNTIWNPKNYDGSYRGSITMRTAVKYSVNTYAVQMEDKIGIRTGFDFACNLGLELIDTPGTNDLGLAPLSLGGLTHGATPVQMTAAYGAIGNGGIYIKPHLITRILDDEGVEIYHYRSELSRAMTPQTSWLMTSMLQTVVESGTGTNAKVSGVPTGGKTGTSEEYTDSWFCGITPQYAAAVWMGYDKEYTMNTVYGGSFPARMFKAVMQKAYDTEGGNKEWVMPPDIVRVSVCSYSGKRPSSSCPESSIVTDFCTKDAVPTEFCNSHQFITICPESGKLAGSFCPNPQMVSLSEYDDDESDSDSDSAVSTPAVPTQRCDIHTSYTSQVLGRNEVFVCIDPRHRGTLMRANIPQSDETGGCPPEYLEKVVLTVGQHVPLCNLEDHLVQWKSTAPPTVDTNAGNNGDNNINTNTNSGDINTGTNDNASSYVDTNPYIDTNNSINTNIIEKNDEKEEWR